MLVLPFNIEAVLSMKNWKSTLIPPTATVKEALAAIDAGVLQIALVVDPERQLLGTVTDGDIRRGILRGLSLDEPVSAVMNRLPTVARAYESPEHVLALMKLKTFRQIPIVDENGRVVGVQMLDELIQPKQQDNWVVLMAGGLGTRLAPLTDACPKPMLRVGGKPLLETIIETFRDQGFRRFFISVNYKAEMIMEHFRDGADWGVTIEYLRERDRLGTAGSLSLLPERPRTPFFVMNADLLTTINFRQMLDFHQERQAIATMGVREYTFQVPYGVVRIDGHRLLGIDEKPQHQFFVNSGIYLLGPEALDEIPAEVPFQMPELFERLIARGDRTLVFPIREYWLDVGRLEDFNRANGEYGDVFP